MLAKSWEKTPEQVQIARDRAGYWFRALMTGAFNSWK
jgi:hypothetical protein